MKQFNGKRKITVEIAQVDGSGCHGYELWQMTLPNPRLIKSSFFEVEDLLSPEQLEDFYNGGYRFTVPAQAVFEATEIFV